MDLLAVRQIAAEVAQAAGAVLMEKFGQPHDQRTKKNVTDIVTEGDKASEAVVLAALTQHFPDHHIISEEDGGVGIGRPADEAEYFWHIDPLDGTSNYASNLPFFSVSIGLSDKNKRPLVGVVYDPFSHELYTASLGGGATLNGKPLRVSTTDHLQQAMLCSGFPYDSFKNPDNNLREWTAFIRVTRGLRRFGSIALELSYVAAGRFDGLWERSVNSWDVMAGILIAREAGASVSDYDGQDSDKLYSGQQILATNTLLHAEMLEILQESRAASVV
ncbi:MAG: inositol monophosphatase family protein [Anaerolineae bacterium]